MTTLDTVGRGSGAGRSAILLIHCPDQKGIVVSVTEFIFRNEGNILYLDQHVDAGTAELDAGPIIGQDVVPISHADSVQDLIRKGRDLEKVVLSRAIWHHVQRKILVFGNRTVIFT